MMEVLFLRSSCMIYPAVGYVQGSLALKINFKVMQSSLFLLLSERLCIKKRAALSRALCKRARD